MLWRVRKSIGNGVDIFVHFFTTPISILNLTVSSESQENDVSNHVLSDWWRPLANDIKLLQKCDVTRCCAKMIGATSSGGLVHIAGTSARCGLLSWSVCVSVCVLVTAVICAKTAEPIVSWFGCDGSKKPCIKGGGVGTDSPMGSEMFEGCPH